jgi:alpha-tubulin suppressor-like RCC1 family protein
VKKESMNFFWKIFSNTSELDSYSELPPELIIEIALSLDLKNIQTLSRVSWKFYQTLNQNELFWRLKFLHDYAFVPYWTFDSWRVLYCQYGVYVVGLNSRGQLGVGDRKNRKVFTKLPIDAQQISAGDSHTLLLDLEHNIYAFGSNSWGQLGAGFSILDLFYSNIKTRPILIDLSKYNIKPKQVSAGNNYSLLIDMNNNVYATGDNLFGQLGMGDYLSRNKFTQIPTLKAQQISAGYDHSLLIDMDDNVYATGSNLFGKLGVDDHEEVSQFTSLNFKAQQISAGGDHSLFIDFENNVYACGNNTDGQLGLENRTMDNYQPIKISNFKAKHIVAAWHYSLIIDLDNQLHIFGRNLNEHLITFDQITDKLRQLSEGSAHRVILGCPN